MRKLFIFFVGLALSFGVKAQSVNGVIKGKVTDTKQQPLEKASISLLEAKDSTIVDNVFTDEKGNFELGKLNANNYLLLITYLGYQQLQKSISITSEKTVFNLGTIEMKDKSVDLAGVTVKEMAPPVALKGDTMEFNAGSFQTRPNAVVEDLLKKIPGLQVDKDGTIKSEGETVNQILVDGKPFFGSDPKLATKNLPVDVIDKVQVFDKQSDQAAFTGIDDGNSSKAINLTIKKDKKKGLFGRAALGAGTDDRYASSASLFRFNDDQQISFLGSGNNTNNMGFTFSDIRNFSGGGGGGRGRGRGGSPMGGGLLGGSSMPGSNGETTAWMGGLNYRDQWGKKISVTGNYFYNYTSNNIIQEQDRKYILPDTSYYMNQNSHSLNKSINQRFNLRIEYQIDSMNSIYFTPTLSYTTNNYNTGSDYAAMDTKQLPVYDGRNQYSNSATSPNLSGSLLYRRKFNKQGRTFSVDLNGGYNTNDADGINTSLTKYYTDNPYTDSVNQHFEQNNTGKKWGVRATYTEPIMKDRTLEVHVAHNNNLNESEKNTYNENPSDGKFTMMDSLYSNSFRNTFSNDQAGFNIQTTKLRYNYTLGMNVQQNNIKSHSISGDSSFSQRTVNFYPEAYFNYTFNKNRRLRIYYRGSTDQPSLSQLQPVPDNSDPLNDKKGNPDLKTSFTNSIRLNYRAFNMDNYHMFFANVSFSTVSNDIVSATYNTGGKQTTQYVNATGGYRANAFITAGLPISDSKNMINSHTSANYNKTISFINGDKNFTRNLNLSQGLDFNYAYKELLDFRISGSVNYNNVNYSLQKSQDAKYFSYESSLDFNINLPAHFMIQTDFDYTATTGRTSGYNQNIAMWNASVSKYIFKKQQGMIKLQAFDLLNQHVSITRNIEANYIEDARTNVIPQYFMLSFTYFLNKFAGENGSRNREGGPPRGMFRHRF